VNQKRISGIGMALVLLLALVIVACGPAVPPEKADDATRIAEGESLFESATEGEEAAVEEEAVAVEEAPVSQEGDLTQVAPPAFSDRLPVELGADEYEVSDTGLQYFDVVEGEGATPQDGDILLVNYAMWVDGETGPQILDDTFFHERPFTFVMGSQQVFPGWEEGMLTMKPGGTRQLVVPSDLAFGAEGVSGMIAPDAAITMEVELLEVQSPPEPAEVDYETTDSGLQIAVLNEGAGEDVVEAGDIATVEFVIWVADSGRYFTGSSTAGAPFTFQVGSPSVFEGWNEGMTGMTVGEKRQLLIPAALGLGEQGFGDIVPPNSDLIMQVEVVDLVKPRKATVVDESEFTVTDSGLKYVDLVEGDGPTPEPGQTVVVHYTGWLEDGTQFDSSVERGVPFEFPLGTGSVIPGWDEGVASMNVGSTRQLVIPSDLAYGDAGAGGTIPPGATLIFEVELLEIK
jgi:peptidylprolyl isomerase